MTVPLLPEERWRSKKVGSPTPVNERTQRTGQTDDRKHITTNNKAHTTQTTTSKHKEKQEKQQPMKNQSRPKAPGRQDPQNRKRKKAKKETGNKARKGDKETQAHTQEARSKEGNKEPQEGGREAREKSTHQPKNPATPPEKTPPREHRQGRGAEGNTKSHRPKTQPPCGRKKKN